MITLFLLPRREKNQGVPKDCFGLQLWGESQEILARVSGYFSFRRHGKPRRKPSKVCALCKSGVLTLRHTLPTLRRTEWQQGKQLGLDVSKSEAYVPAAGIMGISLSLLPMAIPNCRVIMMLK